MATFRPCYGTKAQIDSTPIVNGQFLVTTDTGEAFVDINGVRVKISGSSSGGGGSEEPAEEHFLTDWVVAFMAVAMSESVSGGGPGAGITNTPPVSFTDFSDDFTTSYSIAEA